MNFSLSTFWLPRAKTLRASWISASLFLFFCLGNAFGQQKSLKGKVAAAGEDVTGVTIQNLTTQKATITDFDGNFSIAVSVNDTLVFSAVQLQRKIIPVNAVLLNSSFVTITMEPFVNELKEVVVQPYGLSGDIAADLNRIQVQKEVSATSLGLPNAGKPLPSQSKRLLYEATSGGAGIPLNPILNWISGRTKRLKERVAIDEQYRRTQRVQQLYVDSIFEHQFKIPKARINDFMYFCEVDPLFQQIVANKDQLKLWAYMQRKSKLYRENNGLE